MELVKSELNLAVAEGTPITPEQEPINSKVPPSERESQRRGAGREYPSSNMR